MPGCAESYIAEIAPMLGVRESRRVTGDYILTKEDLKEGKVFPDAIAMGAYHIDIHRPGGTWVESHNVQAYTIPYRCLIARDVDGLLVAGKILSATHEAIASTRVIPICMAEGQAAGTAAALAVRSGCDIRSVDIDTLQTILQENGAEIGRTIGEPDRDAIEAVGQLPLDDDEDQTDDSSQMVDARGWVGRHG